MRSVSTGVGGAIAPAAAAALKPRPGSAEADGDHKLKKKVSCPDLVTGIRKLSIMGLESNSKPKIINGEFGFTLEDVPHLSDYLPDLPVCIIPLSLSLMYS